MEKSVINVGGLEFIAVLLPDVSRHLVTARAIASEWTTSDSLGRSGELCSETDLGKSGRPVRRCHSEPVLLFQWMEARARSPRPTIGDVLHEGRVLVLHPTRSTTEIWDGWKLILLKEATQVALKRAGAQ